MSQYEIVKREVEILKEDIERKRIKVSEACKDLAKYCETTPDPLVSNEKNNPYKQKGGGGGMCQIL